MKNRNLGNIENLPEKSTHTPFPCLSLKDGHFSKDPWFFLLGKSIQKPESGCNIKIYKKFEKEYR